MYVIAHLPVGISSYSETVFVYKRTFLIKDSELLWGWKHGLKMLFSETSHIILWWAFGTCGSI